MSKTTKPEETEQAGGARRDARGARGTAASETPRATREPRVAGRAAASPPAPATEETGLQPSPAIDARPDAAPSREQIARRAYEIYQQRGGGEGQEMDDWIRAEQELKEGRGRRQDET